MIGAIGDREHIARLDLEGAPGVDRMVPILKPYKLASAQFRDGRRTVLDIAGRKLGGEHFAMIAGPCTVESREQTLADRARGRRRRRRRCSAAAPTSRGPRRTRSRVSGRRDCGCSPRPSGQTGLPIVTELMDLRDLDDVLEVADVIQIGARNMQNYSLLTEVGRSGRPALLKRGLSATLEELLMAAEYILKEGNDAVILCERGIRTFETAYRFTLDLTAVPVLQELSHLPVIVDPSHAAGRRDLVGPLSLAAAAAGADGIIVEVHPNPDEAICDGPQALVADEFAQYAERVHAAAAVARQAALRIPVRGERDRLSGPLMATSRVQATDPVRDQRIERLEPLVAPRRLLEELALTDWHSQVVVAGRTDVHAILDGADDRLLVVVGPCSVHDPRGHRRVRAAAWSGRPGRSATSCAWRCGCTSRSRARRPAGRG